MEKMPERKDDILRKLIKPDLLEQPSPDFTKNIMAGLGIEPVKSNIAYKPVISKKGWLLISLITFGIYFFIIMSAKNYTGAETSILQVELAKEYVQSVFHSMISGSIIIYITLATIAVFILFLVESIFRQSRLRTFHI